tara:strand:+ start:21194 stop:21730 length:537 start_codon:yes stop_codon:yes gene_type:complete
MKFSKTSLDGIILIEPDVYEDQRGFFNETYQKKRYIEAGISDDFVQDNHSRSYKNVLRGMHFQVKSPQAQIVTLMNGSIYDVVVDIREKSATFGEWLGVELSVNGKSQLYMPPGFAHGFFVLSDWADIHYKVSTLYNPKNESGIIWNDPEIGIKWPIDSPILSLNDEGFKSLKETIIV